MRKRAPVPSQIHVMDRVCVRVFSNIYIPAHIYSKSSSLCILAWEGKALHTDRVHPTILLQYYYRYQHHWRTYQNNKYFWGATRAILEKEEKTSWQLWL